MAIKKSFLIIFILILSLAIDNANAGWKFWKKDKDKDESTTANTITSTTTISPSIPTKPSVIALSTPKPSAHGSVNKGIVNAADSGLAIGIGATGNNIKNNARPQQPNPGTEVGQDFPNSRPNQRVIGGIDNKNYHDWAVDLTGAGESVNKNPKTPGNPVASPTPGSRLPNLNSNQNPSIPSTPRPNTPIGGIVTPVNSQTGNQKPLIATLSPGNSPVTVSKPSISTPSTPTTGKSWAEIAGGSGSRPGSPIPTVKPSQNGFNREIQPTQPQPTRPTTPRALPTIFTAKTTSATASPTGTKKIYSSNPVYSKGNTVTDDDLEKLSEALFIKDKNNAWRHITLNLQKKSSPGSAIDESPEPLLSVNNAAFKINTIEQVLKIYDNYHLDTTEREHISPLQRNEESLLVDTFLSTNVMSAAMRFLSDKGYMKRDYYDYKDNLRRLWFNLYSRGEGKIGSSGFEHVFMTELKLGTEVSGLHNWIYFNAEEVKKRADYLGYIKKLDLGDKAAILKLHAKFNGIDKPVTSMFIGTSPELEMALYTVCFYARPDQNCPVQLGGSKFNIVTHKFRYRGKDHIGSAYPEI